MAGFRTVWVALVAGLLGLAPPAQARVDLTPEEREIVTWIRAVDPGWKAYESIVRLVQAEEYTRRGLVMMGCARVDGRGIERWLRPNYVAVVRESARHMAGTFDADIRANGHLEDGLEASVLYLWRSWDEGKRERWLAYIGSPAAKLGKNLTRLLAGLGELPSLSEDLPTGKPILAWLGWARELLDAAGLTDSFKSAANRVEPGLGDRFAVETSRPLGELPAVEHQQSMATLGKELSDRWEDIVVALFQSMPPASRAAVEAWSDHPMQEEAAALAKSVADDRQATGIPGLSPPAPGSKPTPLALAKFLTEAGLDGENRNRRIALFADSLRQRLQPHCATLK